MNQPITPPSETFSAQTLTSTYSTDDLRDFERHASPFLTVVLPSPSSHHDAAHRLAVHWKNARRSVAAAGWPTDRLAELDDLVGGWRHGDGEAIVIVQSIDGARLEETLVSAVMHPTTSIDQWPRLLTILENRQRTLPHIVVVTDRVGADVVGFDGGEPTTSVEVEGERLHIHRGHPGGWSQRRFQQRAENTWEENADDVVDATIELASKLEPVFIAVAGEVRAQSMVEAGLRDRARIEIVSIEAGDVDGISTEVVRIVDDHHARFLRAAIRTLRERVGNGTGLVDDAVIDALRDGRVDILFVHDVDDHDVDDHDGDDHDGERVGTVETPCRRFADRAVGEALSTGAHVVVIPHVSELSNGVAATPRW
ncbi:MAG: Vms1/Ankzf1 family peptidyl-tRNA hydrolase [Ilumatobacter sp.]|uniref:baeRF2 domain-containing protein n=1 Tax=Ilumatobacter sp. TaxID=1967498 RepID=UPI00391895AE